MLGLHVLNNDYYQRRKTQENYLISEYNIPEQVYALSIVMLLVNMLSISVADVVS